MVTTTNKKLFEMNDELVVTKAVSPLQQLNFSTAY